MTVLAWFVFFACAAVVAGLVISVGYIVIEAAIKGNFAAQAFLALASLYAVVFGLLWSTDVLGWHS